MKLILIFICLNLINVCLQTANHIITVKSNKFFASFFNALTFGIYTVVLVYMTCDLSLWLKVIVVAGCNLVGAFIVKSIEEKTQKEKVYKIEISIPKLYIEEFKKELDFYGISYNIFSINYQYAEANCYCNTVDEKEQVLSTAKKFNAKYFITISSE